MKDNPPEENRKLAHEPTEQPLIINLKKGQLLSIKKGEEEFNAEIFNVTKEDDEIEIVLNDLGAVSISDSGRRC